MHHSIPDVPAGHQGKYGMAVLSYIHITVSFKFSVFERQGKEQFTAQSRH